MLNSLYHLPRSHIGVVLPSRTSVCHTLCVPRCSTLRVPHRCTLRSTHCCTPCSTHCSSLRSTHCSALRPTRTALNAPLHGPLPSLPSESVPSAIVPISTGALDLHNASPTSARKGDRETTPGAWTYQASTTRCVEFSNGTAEGSSHNEKHAWEGLLQTRWNGTGRHSRCGRAAGAVQR